ncbi:hypothetical protein LB554_09920 [Mesorhizobium sp. CO1-1-11]|uniref:hypothetical protein n=1 Tax=Mesorhizobium sp. CO1-1-11 TaxID=2876636 RepID=UPI001CCF4960|nr:hypothetical protein [Mesorhizobium sp. CO1-1-11]MBZ9724264.1 hypothetical protein [Mesorhizobium sp. CO1-1-11]
MSRLRSPGYPNFSLPAALKQAEKVFSTNRRNPMDRNSAAIAMGYSGSSGAADKAIATLTHYGLLDKVGKGEVRISQLALDILHPSPDSNRGNALLIAAFKPQLFTVLKNRFPDGHVSDTTLRSFLIREEFQNRAIDPVIKAYTETSAFLRQENAYESYDSAPANTVESHGEANGGSDMTEYMSAGVQPTARAPAAQTVVAAPNERVVFTEEGSPGQSLRLVATGEVDDYLLEALEDYVKRQRKRLTPKGQ